MNKLLYPRLAFSNIKKNAKVYIPYIITAILTIGMYYIISALAYSESLLNLRGGDYVKMLLMLGLIVVALFSVIFLFYTNSFLMKRRKKEMGLYNILGMEKKHISIMIFFETFYVAVISLSLGLLFGILFHKLVYLLLLNILGFDIQMGFEINFHAIFYTLIIFTGVFILTLFNNLRQIHLASPIELLHGNEVGEKEPKSNWLVTIIGVLTLGGGYYIAITCQDALSSLMLFFVAVILVIIGTYCLFVSGSITVLKLLKKNKKFYYQTQHFISVSGMIYRMKQNAVGLANICILSTMVLVMISSTTWLYSGVEETVNRRYPREIVVETSLIQQHEIDVAVYQQIANEAVNEVNTTLSNELYYSYLAIGGLRQGNNFITDHTTVLDYNVKDVKQLYFMPLSDYHRFYDNQAQLNSDQALVYGVMSPYEGSSLTIFGRTYQVREIDEMDAIGTSSANMVDSYIIIVEDAQFDWLDQQYAQENLAYYDGEVSTMVCFMYAFDVEDEYDITEQVANRMQENLGFESQIIDEVTQEPVTVAYNQAVFRNFEYRELQSMFGGFFFLGIFLGSLFIMATVLIMYYKQISEGFEDRERFRIMQNVGMSRQEVKKAVHSQVLMVFFLPLIVAGIHIIFAFNLIRLLFSLVSMTNVTRFMISTLLTYLVFAMFYTLIYLLTAKVYEKLVSEK